MSNTFWLKVYGGWLESTLEVFPVLMTQRKGEDSCLEARVSFHFFFSSSSIFSGLETRRKSIGFFFFHISPDHFPVYFFPSLSLSSMFTVCLPLRTWMEEGRLCLCLSQWILFVVICKRRRAFETLLQRKSFRVCLETEKSTERSCIWHDLHL